MASKGRPKSEKGPKKMRAIKLDPAFDLELLRAAYWVPGATVNGIIEEGAALVLERLKKQHNHGKPFPPTPKEDQT